MLASTLSLGLALLPFVSAAVHDIQVAPGGKLQFYPEAIAAQPGDQVVFHFNPKNHTVTQSSFASPCGLKEGGFNSGFIPVPANQTENLPTFTVQVNDTEPIWVNCAQAAHNPNSHCGQGMVFAINCGADNAPNSFSNFKKAALEHGAALSAAATAASTTAGGYGGGYGGYGGGAGAGAGAAPTTTAAYGDYPIPAAPSGAVVTQTITLGSSTWATTYTSYPGSPAPTPASIEGQVHRVIVGGPGSLVFDPPRIDALPRDVVIFEFRQKNHTVTQSAFADPCRPISENGATGFDSGFFPVADGTSEFPTWSLTVNDTAPIWAYCRQRTPASHCGSGMVFAINSDETGARNFAAYQQVAQALNGTAAAANAPPSGTSSGVSVRVGGTGLAVVVALLAAMLF